MTAMDAPREFTITAHDSAAFARLSGDFNPLHVDAVAARRLQFGSTVCHGVHLVLLAIEHAAAGGALGTHGVAAVSAVFQQPVRTGTPVRLTMQRDAEGRQIKFAGHADGRQHFSVQLALGDAVAGDLVPAAHEPEAAAQAANPDFPADAAAYDALTGQVRLRLHTALLATLFPALAAVPEWRGLAADLMASTQVVGMRCPGLNSIYAEFKLQRRAAPTASASLSYRIAKVDTRFRKVRIAVVGALLEGTLDAFFRAPPVTQRSLAEVRALTATDCTRGQRALVVGGSRGLGELVAKMLLAGGAQVTLSYARGRGDAERIVAQATAAGASCSMLQLDASAALTAAQAAELAAAGFTHLYYFATPAISKSGATWSQPLFEAYARIYVAGLAEVARAAAGGPAPLQVFYPSTVFLDHAEKGFAEYCAAKAAGETLCDHLALETRRFAVRRPRLPRLKTDQNSSFLGPEADDPLPVLTRLLGDFCGWQAAS